MTIDWTAKLNEQLTWHWEHARRLLDGMTDAEYLWEPVEGCWSIRPRAEARTPMAAGAGDWVADYDFPEPSPAPVTTIAWRMAHITIGIFGSRAAAHFGGPAIDYFSAVYPPDAAGALAALDESYARWTKGVAGLSEADLARPVGPAEGEWAEHPYAELVLHINREAIHHLAEVCLLRDLYRNRTTATELRP